MVWALTGCGEEPPVAPIVLGEGGTSQGAQGGGASQGPQGAGGTSQGTQAAVEALPSVGLSLEVENGAGKVLRVQAGRSYFVNQVDIRAAVGAMVDEGVSGLSAAGDLANVSWSGVQQADEDFQILPNPDGTFVRRRFYRDAQWMEGRMRLSVRPFDAQGQPTGPIVKLDAGRDDRFRGSDDFFVRRLRAIQWTNDCPGPHDCTGAQSFLEEALVELRAPRALDKTFSIAANTTSLRLTWGERPGFWTIPVEAVAVPAYAYGFRVDLDALTPPGPGGAYAPGTNVEFRVTLRDGAGNRLHPEGSLPSYAEVEFGPNPAGVQYYRAFFDPTAVYYRRKHRERMMLAQIIGPAQDIQPIRSILELSDFLAPSPETQTIGTPARDGVTAQAVFFPRADDLFGGAFDPTHAAWNEPVSDRWTFNLPPDAKPGTYLVSLKAVRSYLGEDTPVTQTIKIQVGTTQPTSAQLNTGGCSSCHGGGGELSKVLHANDDRATCSTCHAPVGFEYEGPVAVRTHFIHSRSNRFEAPKDRCSSCHLTSQGIERTSKAACLSCHKTYPTDHEAQFGPIENMYVGGGRESFDQCTGACHTTHPNSGL